jgi:stage II sporulation protein D
VAVVAAGCGLPDPRIPSAGAPALPERVRVRTRGVIVPVPLEDYVFGSALAEVTPVGETPAASARIYEVQAVLARTYAAAHLGRHRAEGFDVCDATHCQLYDPARIKTSRFSAVAEDAVRRTTGEVLRYGRWPIDALFHADCGGSTAAADAVWGGPSLPYLMPRRDDLAAIPHRAWQFSTSGDALRDALNRDARTAVGVRLTGLEIVARDDSGRAATIAIRGEHDRVVRGEDLRAVLNRTLGDRAIQSTRFTLTRSAASYAFAGSGFGHGVGLCQIGAAARARRGDSLRDILAAYFTGAKVGR